MLLRPPVLSRASEQMPMPLGTLDALHLATALVWRDRMGPLPTIATRHGADAFRMLDDTALDLAARAFGFDVGGT